MRTPKKMGIDSLATSNAKRKALRAIANGAPARKAAKKRGGGAVLFAGRDKTARDAAANALAMDLGRDLLRVDLASVVNKYVGETEKNLARLLARAERTDAVLFFDEADALFGKRTPVKDSHDRYANLEVSDLLRRIERFSGIAIVAATSKSNIDPAFVRRCKHALHFRRSAKRR